MGLSAIGSFDNDYRSDRNFFLIYVVMIWFGILMGFAPKIIRRVQQHATPYPLMVHFHAVAFVGWLVLLTTQVPLAP